MSSLATLVSLGTLVAGFVQGLSGLPPDWLQLRFGLGPSHRQSKRCIHGGGGTCSGGVYIYRAWMRGQITARLRRQSDGAGSRGQTVAAQWRQKPAGAALETQGRFFLKWGSGESPGLVALSSKTASGFEGQTV